MPSAALGVLGIFIAVVMYGSMYVPVKKYKTYDGMLFQWYTSSGSVLIGVVVGILFDWGDDEGIKVPWEGIVGGILYSVVSVLFPLAVKLTGLALSFVLWCGMSIVVGWAISRFGLGSIQPSAAAFPVLDILSIILIMVALIMMMFIRPDSVSVEAVKAESTSSQQDQKLLEYEREITNAQSAAGPGLITPDPSNNPDNTQVAGSNTENDNNNDNDNNNMWPTSSRQRSSKNFRRRRLSMEIAQNSSLIPTAYLFGTWLDFDQLAKDKYFEKKLRKKYNDDTIGITLPQFGRTPSHSISYGSTNSSNSDIKQNASVNLKTIKTHSADDLSDVDENEMLIEQYREMRTNYQWLKPIIYGQCNCGPQARRIFGLFLGLMEGSLCALSYVPYLYWSQTHESEIEETELYILNYVFSYTIGIYLGSTFFFCVMGLYKKCKNVFWPKPVVRPAFSSGCMYALGYAGFLFSTAYISYPVCYVAVMVGSIVMSNLWSLLYFTEITNKKSIRLLSISLGLMMVAIIIEAIAG